MDEIDSVMNNAWMFLTQENINLKDTCGGLIFFVAICAAFVWWLCATLYWLKRGNF